MAIVFLPLNGIGLGHVMRGFVLARELLARGEAPIVVAQGHYPAFMARAVPGCSISPIYKTAITERQRIVADVVRCARQTNPAVVIEDTHPAPMELPADVRRILLVRPTTMQQMLNLQAKHVLTYDAILVTDHWESPTWPFDAAQTAQIRSWSNWSCVGPIVRTPTTAGGARIRQEYSLRADQRNYVFSMGGGGVQPDGTSDIAEFCAQAERIAQRLRRDDGNCRLLFIRGPLFPAAQSLPALFEDYGAEDDMPALLSCAAGAVVRAGFNTTWECLAAGTPFITFQGHTFAEPVVERLQGLAAAGLLLDSVDEWLDPDWIANFKRRAAAVVTRWPLSSVVEQLQGVILAASGADTGNSEPAPVILPLTRKASAIAVQTSPVAAPSRLAPPHWPLDAAHAPLPGLLVRIDDVIELSRELILTLEQCAARGLSVSLEVVPYLCRLDEGVLCEQLAGAVPFEVSQHGYAHLPRRIADGRKSDFFSDQDFAADLQKGLAVLQRLFPTKFRGGFSAPYDTFPPGLGQCWQQLGGRYVSALWAPLEDCPLPVVNHPIDPWDWRRDREHSQARLMRKLRDSLVRNGYTGLALHPQLLTSAARVARLEQLLDEVMTLGCTPVLASQIAARRQHIAASPSHSWSP